MNRSIATAVCLAALGLAMPAYSQMPVDTRVRQPGPVPTGTGVGARNYSYGSTGVLGGYGNTVTTPGQALRPALGGTLGGGTLAPSALPADAGAYGTYGGGSSAVRTNFDQGAGSSAFSDVQRRPAGGAGLATPGQSLPGMGFAEAASGTTDKPATDPNNVGGADQFARGTDSALSRGEEAKAFITSLVPNENTYYSRKMLAGEKAFKEGDYPLAAANFKLAGTVSRDPETYLSMAHAQFGQTSYSAAALYLRRAIRMVPNLAVLRLKPKGFYRDPSIYMDKYIQLEGYLKKHPEDNDAQLLRAYYSWFDRDMDAADKDGSDVSVRTAYQALCRALTTEKDPVAVEAIETFWDGMKQTGMAKGELAAMPLRDSDNAGVKASPAKGGRNLKVQDRSKAAPARPAAPEHADKPM